MPCNNHQQIVVFRNHYAENIELPFGNKKADLSIQHFSK